MLFPPGQNYAVGDTDFQETMAQAQATLINFWDTIMDTEIIEGEIVTVGLVAGVIVQIDLLNSEETLSEEESNVPSQVSTAESQVPALLSDVSLSLSQNTAEQDQVFEDEIIAEWLSFPEAEL